MSENNKIDFFTNLEKRLSVHVNIDNMPVVLEFNPRMLLSLKKEGFLGLFLSATEESLKDIFVSHNNDLVFWEFPEDKQYSNLSGIKLQFDKATYLERLQEVLLKIVRETSVLQGVDRKSISFPGGGNLKEFLMSNRGEVVSALA